MLTIRNSELDHLFKLRKDAVDATTFKSACPARPKSKPVNDQLGTKNFDKNGNEIGGPMDGKNEISAEDAAEAMVNDKFDALKTASDQEQAARTWGRKGTAYHRDSRPLSVRVVRKNGRTHD